jgi:hypothetical protein
MLRVWGVVDVQHAPLGCGLNVDCWVPIGTSQISILLSVVLLCCDCTTLLAQFVLPVTAYTHAFQVA